MPILYASRADRWVHCPGSTNLEAAHPQEREDAATQGIDYHNEAEEALNTLRTGGDVDLKSLSYVVRPYINDIMNICRGYGVSYSTLVVEHKSAVPIIHPNAVSKDDCVLLMPGTHTAVMWELKTGRKPVNAYKNYQMVCGSTKFGPQFKKIIFRVIQPNSLGDKFSSWKTGPDDIDYKETVHELQMAAESAEVYKTGNHCVYCTGRLHCPAFQKVSGECYDAAIDYYSPINPDGKQLAAEYFELSKIQEMLKSRLSAVETRCIAALKSGDQVPGLCIQQSQGRLNWTRPYAEIVALGELLGKDLRQKNLLTPLQADLPKEILEQYAERKTSFKLAVEDTDMARRYFGKGEK